jgi:hypothetical protein
MVVEGHYLEPVVVEELLALNVVVVVLGFITTNIFAATRKDTRLDTAIESMSRLEQSAMATSKMLDDVRTTQEKDQRIRHDLRDYVQGLEVRVARLEERMRVTPR